jgi:hypothetical protein
MPFCSDHWLAKIRTLSFDGLPAPAFYGNPIANHKSFNGGDLKALARIAVLSLRQLAGFPDDLLRAWALHARVCAEGLWAPTLTMEAITRYEPLVADMISAVASVCPLRADGIKLHAYWHTAEQMRLYGRVSQYDTDVCPCSDVFFAGGLLCVPAHVAHPRSCYRERSRCASEFAA